MKLIAAYVFEARRVGRTAEEGSEVLDPLHVVMLGLRRELADRHVFDHALPQRAYGLIGHGGCSCFEMKVANPSSQNRTPRRAIVSAVLPAAASYRASGLVLWHEAEVLGCLLLSRDQRQIGHDAWSGPCLIPVNHNRRLVRL